MRSAVLRHSVPAPDDNASEHFESLADLRARLDVSVEKLNRTIRQTEYLLTELMVSASQGTHSNRRS